MLPVLFILIPFVVLRPFKKQGREGKETDQTKLMCFRFIYYIDLFHLFGAHFKRSPFFAHACAPEVGASFPNLEE